MAGTLEGGRKASATVRERYGDDFYRKIGQRGGLKSRGGGFTGNPELARLAGKKGGRISRRGKSTATQMEQEVKRVVECLR